VTVGSESLFESGAQFQTIGARIAQSSLLNCLASAALQIRMSPSLPLRDLPVFRHAKTYVVRGSLFILGAGLLLLAAFSVFTQQRSKGTSSLMREKISSPKPTRTVAECASGRDHPNPGGKAHNYFNPQYYQTNELKYFNDLNTDTILWQADVYNYAAFLAQSSGGWIVDVGGGSGVKSARIYNQTALNFVELDMGPNLVSSRQNFKATQRYGDSNGLGVVFQEWDVSQGSFPEFGVEKLAGATIVSADVIEHLVEPDMLVDGLLDLFYGCSAENLIISTIDRGTGPVDSPLNLHHVREWTKDELHQYLTSRGADVTECILTHSNNFERLRASRGAKKHTSLCLLSKTGQKLPEIESVHDYFPS
jgi:2-polyprenyl-3-methyl-5-hydroxy-6-metoxy-1,4-benzoquinol methylase